MRHDEVDRRVCKECVELVALEGREDMHFHGAGVGEMHFEVLDEQRAGEEIARALGAGARGYA